MASVFISYSHSDKDYAGRLAKSIEDHGISVWIDDRIDYGTQWPRVIQENLEACRVFVVIMTPRSLDSIWVQNELTYAISQRKFVLPILLEGTVWFSVSSLQTADVTNGSLPPKNFYENISKMLRPASQTDPNLIRHYKRASAPQKVKKERSPVLTPSTQPVKKAAQATELGQVTINLNAAAGMGGWHSEDNVELDGLTIPIEPFDTGLFSGDSKRIYQKSIPVGKHHIKIIWRGEKRGHDSKSFIVSKDKHIIINLNEEMHFWRSYSEWSIEILEMPVFNF